MKRLNKKKVPGCDLIMAKVFQELPMIGVLLIFLLKILAILDIFNAVLRT